jgi:TetR/AcrR family transcriptional repressor of nem operon
MINNAAHRSTRRFCRTILGAVARPRKFVEQDVLEAARDVFWRQGYDGASLAGLRQATGVGSQSLYGAFGTKHDLFMRTLDDYCDRRLDGLSTSREQATSAWQWLLAVVTLEDDQGIATNVDGCFLAGSTSNLARLDPGVRDLATRTYERIADCFCEAVEAARRSGELRADVDPRPAAVALLTAMQGLEFMRRTNSEELFDAARRSVRDGLCRAYAVQQVQPPPTP